jgi:FxsC-like protein
MTDVEKTKEKPLPEGRSYFYLSYAHSSPLAGDSHAGPDKSVRQFFDDLTKAVNDRAAPGSRPIHGFFDQKIPIASDWKESLSRALGKAEVFVPLYSPGYFIRSWPGREWACFRQRLVLAGLKDPERRFAPVLWTPLLDQDRLPGLRAALEVGASEAEYEKSGLRRLLQLETYHDSYNTVVDQLAERVVTLAEESQLVPSAVPDIDQVESAFQPEARLAEFAVAAAAPTQDTVPAGVNPGCYGANSIEWRPFQDQELSLAQYVRRVAERLDFKVEFTSLDEACDQAAGRPGIILIDPWFIAGDQGRALRSAVRKLPPWVLPLLVLSSPDDAIAGRLAEQVWHMLGLAGAPPTESLRRTSRYVSSLKGFVDVVPALVAEAERRFLRHGGGYAPRRQPGARRPRLSGPLQPDLSDPAPHPAGETPDA